MARSIDELRVFVSSPHDMEPYKRIITEIASEKNTEWKDAFGIVISLFDFNSVPASLAPKGPQDFINQFFRDKYDIYFGLMGNRFGSPTHSFGSGTEEEYWQAVKGYLDNQNPQRVFFGFSREPVSPYSIDLEQFAKVKHFRKEISGQQIYFEWGSKKEFRRLATHQLSYAIGAYASDARNAVLGRGRYK